MPVLEAVVEIITFHLLHNLSHFFFYFLEKLSINIKKFKREYAVQYAIKMINLYQFEWKIIYIHINLKFIYRN